MRIETKHENDEIGWGEAVQLSFTRWPNGWHEVGQMAAFCLNFENSGYFVQNYFSLISIEN
jgi:hypothetical protein